jgi:DNA-binding transcriptional LysR family regulator
MPTKGAFDSGTLEIFVSVCELRSLTKAARYLNTTQAAVSQRIKKLEDQAGVSLIDRQLRPLKLTPAGRILFVEARELVAKLRHLETQLAQHSKLPIDEFRFGMPDALATPLLPHLIPQIRHLSEKLLVRVDSSVNLCTALLERELDIVVTNDSLAHRDDLERLSLLREPMILLCRNSEPVERRDLYGSLQWLAAHRPFVRFTAASPLARRIALYLRQINVHPPRTLEFNSPAALIEMVKHGLGWTITTPLNLMQTQVSLKGFLVHKLPRGDTTRSTWLLARRGEFGTLPAKLAAMNCELLRKTTVPRIAKELPWLMSSIRIAKPPFRQADFAA